MLSQLFSLLRKKKRTNRNKRTIHNKRGGNKTQKFKSMNCNPSVEGKTVTKQSCFTLTALHKIRDAYNKSHTENRITITDPHLLWLEIKSRLSTCEKEDCWLEQIHDKNLKEKIDELSFAPDHPSKWKKNPDEWLSNYDIEEVLEQYEAKHKEFKFIGPTPIDFDSRPQQKNGKCVWEDLCHFSLDNFDPVIRKIGVVFNLDKHNEPGSHWVSLFIDLENQFMFYLDSAGDDVPSEVQELINRIQEQWSKKHPDKKMKIYKNHPFEHQQGNTECGMYSLFFIITLLTHRIDSKDYSTDELIKMFKSKRIPDNYVFDYRKRYFNSN
jgi:signal recognition particle subunit SEC65